MSFYAEISFLSQKVNKYSLKFCFKWDEEICLSNMLTCLSEKLLPQKVLCEKRFSEK
jgi:hypothetical protein